MQHRLTQHRVLLSISPFLWSQCWVQWALCVCFCVCLCVFAPCSGEHFDLCEHKTQTLLPLLLPLRWLREGFAATHLFENTTSKQAWGVPGANKPLQILQGPALASRCCASLLVVLNTALSSPERRILMQSGAGSSILEGPKSQAQPDLSILGDCSCDSGAG